MGLVVVDCCPNVGNFLEGFQRMTEKINTPALYVPIYNDINHKDWSDMFWTGELVSLFQRGELKVDGHIVTLEIPDAIVKKYGSMDDFKIYYDAFLLRHPPTKTFKSKPKRNEKDVSGPITTPLPKKRPLEVDLSDRLVDASSVVPEGDQCLVEVPVVNARASQKLATMPIFRVTEKVGPYILNETGQDALLFEI
ncbi:unnamed protein product [Durusdinium trenchii]|uniref:Cleavage and polyadenylation specificity factor subunit 2 n=1 Tax=Durusdinium trenchii TaxID=1381693 RepID=A0ABP0NBK7_9DINO